MTKYCGSALTLCTICLLLSCASPKEDLSVKDVMDSVVSRFYRDFAKYQLDTISHQFILQYLSEEEKEVLATQYWIFDVNIPVTVSIMRDTAQQVIPFWIVEAGFQMTDRKSTRLNSSHVQMLY